jgi:hypothetical protein
MLTMLAAMVPQHSKEKKSRLLDIFYASPTDPECKPSEAKCEFHFVSLLAYMDSANISETIQTYITSLSVPNYPVQYRDFQPIRDKLRSLSKDLVSNDISNAGKKARSLYKTIENNEKNIEHLNRQFSILKEDVEKIIEISSKRSEAEKLFLFSDYMLGKGFNLHAITLLYEALTQYVFEYVGRNRLEKYFVYAGDKMCMDEKTIYSRKNCLKKTLSNAANVLSNDKLKRISDLLYVLDRLRNTAAHAFLDDAISKKLQKVYKRLGMRVEWNFEKKLVEIHERIKTGVFD